MTQDYYEVLQVHPRADATAVEAAYTRLCELYDPNRLDGAADELVDLARAKRDAIERAYAVLSDPDRRAAYDEVADALRGDGADGATGRAGDQSGRSPPHPVTPSPLLMIDPKRRP